MVIKNQHFYVKKDLLQLKEEIKSETEYDIQIAIDGDKLYGIFTICEYEPYADEISDENLDTDNESSYSDKCSVDSNPIDYRVFNEVRTFKFEKETLVETGLKWKLRN